MFSILLAAQDRCPRRLVCPDRPVPSLVCRVSSVLSGSSRGDDSPRGYAASVATESLLRVMSSASERSIMESRPVGGLDETEAPSSSQCLL